MDELIAPKPESVNDGAAPIEAPLNLAELAEQRRAFRQAAHDPAAPTVIRTEAATEAAGLTARIHESWTLFKEGGLTAAKQRLRRELRTTEQLLSEAAVTEQFGADAERYYLLSTLTSQRNQTRDFLVRKQLEISTAPAAARSAIRRVIDLTRAHLQTVQAQINQESAEHPIVARAFHLIQLVEGLRAEGHLAPTESVVADLERIGQNLQLGKPMLLWGPTGTGKTSLARFAAQHFTGQRAEVVYCNPQTRESSVWGKTGIRPAPGTTGAIETVDIYGPLAKAMIEGRVVLFDEFNALPVEQMDFLKGIFNAKVGDTVNVVGNGTVTIQPGFQMIFTANLKSEKNPERQALPPQIAREFEQNNLQIQYVPKEEAYDIIRARLWQRLHEPNGSLRFSWHDLQVTLLNLCSAMAEIQRSYTQATDPDVARVIGQLDASGVAPGLKKLVLTQGTVEAIIDAWENEQHRIPHRSFVAFLDDRLKRALTFGEYHLADRQLAAKIMAAKGLLQTLTPEQLGLPADTFNFEAIRTLRGSESDRTTLVDQSATLTSISLAELADLDPFGTRAARAADKAKEFIANHSGSESIPPNPGATVVAERYQSLLAETYALWYPNQPDKATVTQRPTVTDPRSPLGKTYAELSADVSPADFGAYTLNEALQVLTESELDGVKLTGVELSADWNGKTLAEVAQHIAQTYPASRIPDLAIWSRILRGNHPNLKNGKWNFCFGSLILSATGHWRVPFAIWDGSAWRRSAYWLGNRWFAFCRVGLLEP